MSLDIMAVQSDEIISVLEQLPEGVFVVDSSGRIVFANKPGQRLIKMKPKKTLGEIFPYPREDGAMRDFDVEMLVKPVLWGGQEASFIHLKPLKSGGAFHLEWKLEAALEKARAAELQLEEWKKRSEIDDQTSSELSELDASSAQLELALQEAKTEADLRYQEYEDRVNELELLLEQAESRADELESGIATDDHQSATELQQAVDLARESEQQLQALEQELERVRERVRVAEEQAEVAEDRSYTLEYEVSRLTDELGKRALEASELKGQKDAIEDEISILIDRVESKEDEIAKLADRLSIQDAELKRIASLEGGLDEARASFELEKSELLSSNEDKLGEIASLQETIAQQEKELHSLQAQLAQVTRELDDSAQSNRGACSRIEALQLELEAAREEKLEALSAGEAGRLALELELAALRAKLEEAEDTLRVRSEESDELAEQLRVENEHYEEILEELRRSNEDLQERIGQEEGAQEQVERLQKQVQKLTTQLDEISELAEKGQKIDGLQRKLEGALSRAEEAEQRLEEEKSELNKLQLESQAKIAAFEEQALVATKEGVDPEAERLAFQDPLTGLPNRNILYRYLGFMLRQAARYNRYVVLLRIDCDKFRSIVETVAGDAGDQLLRLLGERLSGVVRGSDVLGRLDEDEFVILIPELKDQDEASVVAASIIKRIFQVLKKPFSIGEHKISLGVSIGASLFPLDASNGEQMLEHAAMALRRAKENGGGQVHYFTLEMQAGHDHRQMIDADLKLGLERSEFGLLYQPIFDLSSNQIIGVESLIRWNHPRLGLIGPEEFLKVAEESGVIVVVGAWALRVAIAQAARWQQAGRALFVSLNLSRRQLFQADVTSTIQSALAEFKCSSDRIIIEIPEALAGSDLTRLRNTISGLQQIGVRLAVDNFGTSSSSLLGLKRGPFQVLKIDKEFIHGLPSQEENTGVVLSALTMGHHLGLTTIAVGVESEEEKDWLQKTGCRFVQGNGLALPMTADELTDIWQRG